MIEKMLHDNLRICFPNKRIFISRDHNFAFAAWEIGRLRGYIQPGASLIHIDSHLDYCDNPIDVSNIKEESQAVEIANQLDIVEFIIPAQKNGTLKGCFTISDDTVYIEQSEIFRRAYTYNHYEQVLRENWYQETEGTSLILDLDLDYFNKNYSDYNSNALLLPEETIRTQLLNMKEKMWNWDMITVALSPEFCGGEKECEYLLNLFLDVFDLQLENGELW
ncbi:hypothetical protein AX282_06180 [Bacillus spizizenii]|uniref:UPF0489 family protein n=1 Tax=Bacillus spizizenii TaxID=96241 RepID=UPI000772597A|nr:UPF0489 family protein [Bacillus spizizenii]KXJ35308.1 hypothetical protein AX282_06180 [Bacillus spizizenii]